jgi:hypothetical protein
MTRMPHGNDFMTGFLVLVGLSCCLSFWVDLLARRRGASGRFSCSDYAVFNENCLYRSWFLVF